MRTLSVLIGSAAMLAAATQASAQVIYEGVRYQWGPAGNVFYGGTQPAEIVGAQTPLPPGIRAVAQKLGYTSTGYTYVGPDARWSRGMRPLVYSDLVPWREAGQLGLRPDDARNEAYANVPLLQTSAFYRPAGVPVIEETSVAAAPPRPQPLVDPRWKAIPLLNWARMKSTRANPELREAILRQAAEYDPIAAERTRGETYAEDR